MTIHSTAIVDRHAELGRDVVVGPHAIIEKDVIIGDGTTIGPHASIMRYTTVGSNCRIHAGAVIGDLPQDLSFVDVKTAVVMGDQCIIRENVTIHRGTKENSETRLGSNCYLMTQSHLAHNVVLGNHVILAGGALLAGYVEVGDRAFISGNSVVHQFTRIGRLAMLGGACGVSKDVLPFCTVKPVTPNTLLGLNIVGLRRAGFSPEDRLCLKKAFQILFRSGLNLKDAMARMQSECGDTSLIAEWRDFISKSKRGICHPRTNSTDDDAEE